MPLGQRILSASHGPGSNIRLELKVRIGVARLGGHTISLLEVLDHLLRAVSHEPLLAGEVTLLVRSLHDGQHICCN